MDPTQHARDIGGLLTNLHSLEFQIRAYLAWNNLPQATGMPQGHKLADFHVDNEYHLGAITSYDTLGQLIGKFNEVAAHRSHKLLDVKIRTLRDRLAHGRCVADSGDEFFRLIGFSQPNKSNIVRVLYNEVMDAAWYSSQQRLLADAFWVLEHARQQS